MATDPDELELVARASAGDAGALEALYRGHRDWVTGLAFRMTGSQADALDVLQETFLYLFSRFPLRLTASLRSFLYPVVKHHCINVLRRRRKVVDLDAWRAGREEVAVGWLAGETGGDLERRVAGLPAGQAEVVRLRFGLDFSLEEIADSLSIPLGTVKSRLHNALKTLREAADRENRGGQ